MNGMRKGGLPSALLGFALSIGLLGCDVNLVGFVADDSDDAAQIEKARILMDQRKESEAIKILEPLTQSPEKDSNEIRQLLAAAKLGEANLGLWDIVLGVLDAQSSNMNDFMTNVSNDLLSADDSDEEKDRILSALLEAVEVLQGAPDPDDPATLNAACIIGGFAALPVGNDVSASLNGMVSALQQVSASIQSGGCDTTPLETEFGSVDRAISLFQSVKSLLVQCPILKDTPVDVVNTIIDDLVTSADKGCQAPTCNLPIEGLDCADLFPSCVMDIIQSGGSSAVSGDGVVVRCEMMMHCLNPLDCFQSL